ncbi:tol-pal system protein [Paracoccus sp. R86501]|uniref:tol-pal system protein n=1 Tax=Paracoccus sp. R86501 TaxID=3101711 RepID=UPI00366BA747
MIRRAALSMMLAVTSAGAASAAPDAATLADLRGQLSDLRGQLQSLRSELRASGAAGYQAAGGATAIDRMDAMESQLMQLTNQAERLQNHVNGTAHDMDRQLSDLEFRLCEVDDACDLSSLTTTVPQTGGNPELAPAAPAPSDQGAPAVTRSEQADFDAAREALDKGDHARAAQMFADVAQTHAGGPLTAEALFLRGQALQSAGQPRDAAAAWLEGFAADPDGPRAGESLLGIATVIAGQGDATAACLYLAEIPARFPGTPQAATAEQRVVELGCGVNDLGALDPLLDPTLDPEAAADMAEYQ